MIKRNFDRAPRDAMSPRHSNGTSRRVMKAYFIGGGIGSLADAAFLVRDAQLPGHDIAI
ncbi:protein of unknown function [Bradyrhizobium vignae]|uniref:Uncharacterized protein n=1 Tax=Bradyrhizobium vignae TaxID=1549949 RepID=A0A2U3QCA0_9BRAD|nr:protein of unknown function [Bradyrhizobium vignae]